MTTAPTTPTAPEKKRSVLTRTQARFVEDALEELLTRSDFWDSATRKTVLGAINARCEPRGFQITMANMVAAAETVQVTLPGSRDADTERDRELLEALANTMDQLVQAIDPDAKEIVWTSALRNMLRAWQTFRAGPLFAGKGETQG